jgi:hypothetical protein
MLHADYLRGAKSRVRQHLRRLRELRELRRLRGRSRPMLQESLLHAADVQ